MLDIVIISVPGVTRQTPQAAPALLKASVESAGFSCCTIDFNIKFYQESVDVDELETYFSTGLNKNCQAAAEAMVEKWTREILSLNPKYVGISVFTYQNRIASRLFCEALRKLSSAKIVLGGQGLSDGGIEGSNGFGKMMLQQELADFCIRSEGEISLIELLKGNTSYPGINTDFFQQVENLDVIPFPNYDDYQMELYQPKMLPITGSRGCVRSCSFCDIHEHWKFRYRRGEKIAEEMIFLQKKYGVNQFFFTDSLVNGNMKEFSKFISYMAQHNETATQKLSWSGQFIVRSRREVSDTYWENISKSGGYNLAIGVETGSDRVRFHMNKKFSNEDLDYTMQELEKYKISCTFLMIVGYPTETDQDFQETLNMFERYQNLVPHVIQNVNIGSTLGILPGTPLYKQASEIGILTDQYENNWINLTNPDLTLDKRLERRNVLKNYLIQLGYHLNRDSTEHMLEILNHNKEKFAKRIQIIKRIKNIA